MRSEGVASAPAVAGIDSMPAASRTSFICFLAAMLEGFDLQSTGVAASRIAQSLHLGAGQLGLVFSLGTFGLLPGAMIGGRLADRFGRKRLLLAAMVLFGVFSGATALADTLTTVAAARFLTGLGLGAALPTLIALTVEAVPADRRSRAVSMMYAGLPLGGVGAAVTGLLAHGEAGWHMVFYVGGVLPIVLVPLVFYALPESRMFDALAGDLTSAPSGRQGAYGEVLFGGGRLPITLRLWTSYFFTLLVVYLLLNWLPTLLAGKGFSRVQAGQTQIVFNICATLGSLAFGFMMDRSAKWLCVLSMYAGVLLAILGLILAATLPETQVAGFFAGFFVVGGQLVLYALAPGFYDTLMRGTGVGAAVGIGRLGAIVGPAAAGAILARGYGANMVLATLVPGLLLALIAALDLVTRQRTK